jgi:putative DNA primase/helicase
VVQYDPRQVASNLYVGNQQPKHNTYSRNAMCGCVVVLMISDIDRASDALFYIDAGCSREDWIRIGMAAKASGLSFDDFHSWSATAGNYSSEKECHTVWQSFKAGGGVTSSTLYAMAYESGWTDSNTHVKSPRPSLSIVKPKISPQTPIVQATHANALQVWNECIHATLAEGYINRKQGNAEGLRVYPTSAKQLIIRNQNVAGYLVVPCWSGDKLQTLQFIPQGEGDKLNLPSASFNDGFFTVGKITDKVYLCEGIGQAWAIHKVTGQAAIVCFGAGRLNRVAEVVRAEMPIINMVLVPDVGKEIQAAEIAVSVSCGYVELPEGSPKNFDVNDYLIEHGASALADLLSRVKAPAMKYKLLSGANLYNAAPMKWMIRGVLPAEGLAALYGASGSGTSFLALDMGCAIANGAEWFGRRVTGRSYLYNARLLRGAVIRYLPDLRKDGKAAMQTTKSGHGTYNSESLFVAHRELARVMYLNSSNTGDNKQ